MKNLHPIMVFGSILHVFVRLYGGEEHTQKYPVGFMAFFCGGIFVIITGIVTLLYYI